MAREPRRKVVRAKISMRDALRIVAVHLNKNRKMSFRKIERLLCVGTEDEPVAYEFLGRDGVARTEELPSTSRSAMHRACQAAGR